MFFFFLWDDRHRRRSIPDRDETQFWSNRAVLPGNPEISSCSSGSSIEASRRGVRGSRCFRNSAPSPQKGSSRTFPLPWWFCSRMKMGDELIQRMVERVLDRQFDLEPEWAARTGADRNFRPRFAVAIEKHEKSMLRLWRRRGVRSCRAARVGTALLGGKDWGED